MRSGIYEQQGYTIFELMLSLSMLVSLSFLGYAGLGFLESQQERQFLGQFMRSIQTAKLAALLHQKPVWVCGSVDQQQCSTYPVWEHYWIILQENKVLASYPILKGARMQFNAFHPNRYHALYIEDDGMTCNHGTFLCTYQRQGRYYARKWVVNNAARIYIKS